MMLLIFCMAAYFGIRLHLLKNGIRRAERELEEMMEHPQENRILRLVCPDKDLERLLETANRGLEKTRENRILYEAREKEFRHQIENLSHDLRTPLTAVRGYLKMMDQGQMDEQQRECWEVVCRRTENLQHLISQFYEYSVVTSPDFRLELQKTDCGAICRERLLDCYQRFQERGLAVQVSIPDTPVYLDADAQALGRIWENLLENAARYAFGTLKVEVQETPDGVRMLCANDTQELTGEDIPRLFDRFYMAQKARSRGGTGLGLTISRQLTERMGGSMRAEWKDGWLTLYMEFEWKK